MSFSFITILCSRRVVSPIISKKATLPVWMCAAHYIPALQVNEWNHTDLRAEAFHWSVCFMYWSSPVNLCIRSYLYWHGHGFLPSVQMCTPVCSYPLSCNVKSRYFRLVQVCVCVNIRCLTVRVGASVGSKRELFFFLSHPIPPKPTHLFSVGRNGLQCLLS